MRYPCEFQKRLALSCPKSSAANQRLRLHQPITLSLLLTTFNRILLDPEICGIVQHLYFILAMSLCSYCSTIPVNLFSSGRKEQCHHDHQPNYNALRDSATAGCPFCKFMFHAISVLGPFAQKPHPWKEDQMTVLYSTKFNSQSVNFWGHRAAEMRGGWIPDEWCELYLITCLYNFKWCLLISILLRYSRCF